MPSRLLSSTPVCGLVLGLCLGCSSAMRVERASGLGATRYKHLVVAVGIDSLALRREAEESFAAERSAAADVIPSVSFLEAGRGYEPEEMDRAFKASGADAVAIVSFVRDGRDSVKYAGMMPQRVCLSRMGGTCRQWGIAREGVDVIRPYMRFSVEVYEMATSRMMWRADVRTTGRPNDSSVAILRRLAHDVVAAWEKDGVLVRPSPATGR